MKKLICTILVVVVLLSAISFAACNNNDVVTKESPDGVWNYVENDDGTITLYSINKFSENMVVPAEIDGKTVSALGEKLFVIIDDGSKKKADKGVYRENTVLKTVEFLAQIKELPPMSFYFCSALENVLLPATLESVGSFAFFNCTSLKQISFPENMVKIGDYAFRQCLALEQVIFNNDSDDVITLGDKVFFNLDENVPKDKQYYISDNLSIFVNNIALYDAETLDAKRIESKNKKYKYWLQYVEKGCVKEK